MTTERTASMEAGLPSANPILPPRGMGDLPPFDRAWLAEGGPGEPYLSYVDSDPSVNWSDALEALHEESSLTHFIDRWTRTAIVDGIGPQFPHATIADIGCSTGYLLADLRAALPQATLIGVDLIPAGLRKAHQLVPSARLLHADACQLPLADESIDAVVCANLLEHIGDDLRALREIARVLRPGGQAAIVVPEGPRTFDYYDRFLGHVRRYARGELAAKCAAAGLEPIEDVHIAGLLYPAFWLVKQLNRRRYGHLQGTELQARVQNDITRTRDSLCGHIVWQLEVRLARAGVRMPFGIRSLVVAQRGHRS